tara:strand:+ start:3895 stop:4302 length:408 start_codon:yes stop_codon:yes gene_type:complete
MTDTGYIKKSKSDCWGTPKEMYDKYINDGYFDPCPYNYKEDGLKIEWKEKNFVNPPFSNLAEWSKKVKEEYEKGKEIILFIPARTDTKYFHNYLLPCNPKIKFIKGRVKYIDLDDSSKTKGFAPFPSLLLTFNKK